MQFIFPATRVLIVHETTKDSHFPATRILMVHGTIAHFCSMSRATFGMPVRSPKTFLKTIFDQ